METRKYGFIGCGTMATAIIQGLIKVKAISFDQIGCYHISSRYHDYYHEHNIYEYDSYPSLISNCEFVFLCMKPNVLKDTLEHASTYFPQVSDSKVFVSIAAGVTLETISTHLPYYKNIIRMNPNTPCMVQKGIFGVCTTPTTDQQYMDFIETLFNTIGQTFIIEEKNMDAFAALTGCGPAYVYMFIDALADAGVRVGLPRNLAISLAAGTVEGSAEMVQQSGLHPDALKDQVCSPGGSTIEGVVALEEHNFRFATIDAITKAYLKNQKLGK